ncbi:MAG: hypothetical protein ISS19_04350 [Bacteroidales bacterium]|nr:hypothetical protein [Bacteroidales bacterium]
MTTKELIKELQQLSPDTRIIIRAYEGGYNDILSLIPMMIIPHPGRKADYYGEFTIAQTEKERIDATRAVELFGENTQAER